MTMTTELFLLTFTHKYGTDTTLHITRDEAEAAAAGYARDWWENDRADINEERDPDTLSDEEVLRAYFDDNEYEEYSICRYEVPMAQEPVDKAGPSAPAATMRWMLDVQADLLAALKEATRCLAWHEERHGVAMDRKAVEDARAAIAKVEGR